MWGTCDRRLGPALPGGERQKAQRQQRAVERECVLGEEEGTAGNDKFMVTDCCLDTLWKQQEGLGVGQVEPGWQAECRC